MSGPALEIGSTSVPMPQTHLVDYACFLKEDDRKVSREMFPLPSFCPGEVPRSDLSRSVQRRLERRHHVGEMVEQCIMGLNAMYSGGKVCPAVASSSPSIVQQAVMEHVVN